jgi:FkbM family methyltransferase
MRIPTVTHPIRLRPATTDWVIMEQIYIDQAFSLSQWPDHERAIHVRYENAIARGLTPVIVDCGAHIGLATLWFAVKFPRARIFAIEPASENFDILCWNVKPYPNITPVHAAVWDHEARVRLVNPGNEPWAWETKEYNSGEVPTVTLPGLLGREPDSVPLVVKIDIEGSEIEVFRTNLEWIERTPLIVIELHDWQGGWRGTGHAVFSGLSTHPRDYMQRGENMFSFAHHTLPSALSGVNDRRLGPSARAETGPSSVIGWKPAVPGNGSKTEFRLVRTCFQTTLLSWPCHRHTRIRSSPRFGETLGAVRLLFQLGMCIVPANHWLSAQPSQQPSDPLPAWQA